MADPQTSPRAPGPVVRLLPVVVALLALGVTAWRGADLYTEQEEIRVASRWLAKADDWQTLLVATARAVEGGEIEARSEGGFHVPWQADSSLFPIDIQTAESRVAGLLGGYPLSLEEHGEARQAFQASGALLQVTIGRIWLESGIELRPMARDFDRHAADLARLSVPVSRDVADRAESMVGHAFTIVGVLVFALLLCFVLRPRGTHR